MTRFVALMSLTTVCACGLPSGPQPEPFPEPQTDAGVAPTDAGVAATDAGVAQRLPCADVPITRHCDDTVCWKNPAPLATDRLVDVFAVGCQAWAVGSDGLLIERTDAGWKPHAVGTPSFSFNAVAGTAADDVWAVGDASILHFDGNRWNVVASNFGKTNAAWTNERNVVFVAGDVGVHRFTGSRRGFVSSRLISAPFTTFTSVVGLGNTLYALGTERGPYENTKQAVWTFDGRVTTKVPLDQTMWLSRLGLHDGRVFGVGALHEVSGRYANDGLVTEVFRGAPWASTDQAFGFYGMASLSPTEFVVVGTGYPESVMRFDGFGLVPVPGAPRADLFAASASDRDVFVVGTKLGRISNGKWKDESEGPLDNFTSAVVFERETWVSGGYRMKDDGPLEPTFHSRGYLGDIAGLSPTDLYATNGSGPGLWHFDGTAWATVAGGPNEELRHVKVSSTGEVWAWNQSAVFTLARGVWTKVALETFTVFVQDVLELPNGEALISATTRGQRPYLWHVTSAGVKELEAGSVIRHLAGTSASLFYAVSDGGLLRFDETGGHFVSELGFQVLDLAMRRDGQLVFASTSGTVHLFTGSRFAQRFMGSSVMLQGIAFAPNGAVVLVGTRGAVVELRW